MRGGGVIFLCSQSSLRVKTVRKIIIHSFNRSYLEEASDVKYNVAD